LRDVAALDAMVRLKLLAPEEATLEERLRMEGALCAAERFSEFGQSAKGFLDSTENPALIKAFSTAIHLRGLARQLVANNPSDDISELYIALFYYAVDALRFESLSELQRDHALLSASVLYEAIQGVVHRRYVEMEIENLEGKLQDKGRFQLLSIASHQLKTPLGNIHVILEDMKAGVYGAVNDKQEQRLEQAIASVAREFKMIERMLDLTRVESGRLKPDLIPCNLLDCLRGAIDDNRSTLERKSIALRLMLPQDGIRITGDATLLTGAFSNVLENAAKFTERGEVGVRCESEKDWVNIEIWDTGLGISEEALPHIFDNYFQADAGLARQFDGLGAGLSLAKEWLKLHGGTIEAKSERGKGTTFMIRLPVHQVSVIGV
jgi:signal transduction histidine kinase